MNGGLTTVRSVTYPEHRAKHMLRGMLETDEKDRENRLRRTAGIAAPKPGPTKRASR